MSYEVRSLRPEHPVVEIRYSGRVTADEVSLSITTWLALAAELDTWRLLADCTDLAWTPTITDLKDLVTVLADLGVSEHFCEAMVTPTDVTAAVGVGFWATAGVNRGLDVSTFRTRAEALAWLGSGPPGMDRLVPVPE